jgi:hypothetical protein
MPTVDHCLVEQQLGKFAADPACDVQHEYVFSQAQRPPSSSTVCCRMTVIVDLTFPHMSIDNDDSRRLTSLTTLELSHSQKPSDVIGIHRPSSCDRYLMGQHMVSV